MGVHMETVEEKYSKYKNSATRRRLLKKQMDDELEAKMTAVIERLRDISGTAAADGKDRQKLTAYYKQLKDTFNAFDGDGSGQLGFPEYVEAWKFLNRPGGPDEIKKAFDSVDIDGSGVCDWNEFAFSLMGESALAFGPLAELELLNELLDSTSNLLTSLNEGLADSAKMIEERAERNAEL